ncbi:GtrA family protein [Sphingomonas sp. LHG3443-2]|uniref:GtrA family protein n=1 Tax=Sphingomonas sp. LHG3443-2 TaxID=2804639 RepID=UPI003CF231E6
MSDQRSSAIVDQPQQQAGGRPLRYVIAAGLNTAFGLAIYPLLLWSSEWLHQHYMVALVIAQATSLLFAFTTYRLGVFQTRGDTARQFGLFSSFYLFNYAANWAALPLLVEVGGIHPIIAQLGFALVLMIGSYFWHSRVTFKARGSK